MHLSMPQAWTPRVDLFASISELIALALRGQLTAARNCAVQLRAQLHEPTLLACTELSVFADKHHLPPFYTDAMEPASLDPDAVMHPYYVRTAAPDAWLEERVADRWDCGVITKAVPTFEMLSWAKEQLRRDPACFIAGIR